MPTVLDLLTSAVQLHQQGSLAQAEALYLQALAIEPDQADALQLLGLVCQQTGRYELALEYIEDDELIEVTPASIRLRKRALGATERRKLARSARAVEES